MTDLARATGRKSMTIQFGNKLVSEALKGFTKSESQDDPNTGEAAANTFLHRRPSSPCTSTFAHMSKCATTVSDRRIVMSICHQHASCLLLTLRRRACSTFEKQAERELVTIQMKGLRCDSKTVNVRLIRRYVGVDSIAKSVLGPHYVSQSKAGTEY